MGYGKNGKYSRYLRVLDDLERKVDAGGCPACKWSRAEAKHRGFDAEARRRAIADIVPLEEGEERDERRCPRCGRSLDLAIQVRTTNEYLQFGALHEDDAPNDNDDYTE